MEGPLQLETPRLLLRRPQKGDAEAVRQMESQEFVRRYNCLGPQPPLEETERLLTEKAGNQLLLEEKETGRVIGHIGMKPDDLRHRVEAVMLDYYLEEAHARKGYMSEALGALVGWLFDQGGARVVSARVFTENAASLALLEKLGFTQEGTLRQAVQNEEGHVFDDALFSILREEHQSRRPRLGGTVRAIVDRPLGSRHPRHPEMVYPVNYGYVPGVMAPDGAEQDVYILGVDEPVGAFTGRLVAVIHRFDDVEEKWVLAPEGMVVSKEEIKRATHFQERYFHSEIRM